MEYQKLFKSVGVHLRAFEQRDLCRKLARPAVKTVLKLSIEVKI
jgi:hypothetical protein